MGKVMGGSKGPRLGFQARALGWNPRFEAGSPIVQCWSLRNQGLKPRVSGFRV